MCLKVTLLMALLGSLVTLSHLVKILWRLPLLSHGGGHSLHVFNWLCLDHWIICCFHRWDRMSSSFVFFRGESPSSTSVSHTVHWTNVSVSLLVLNQVSSWLCQCVICLSCQSHKCLNCVLVHRSYVLGHWLCLSDFMSERSLLFSIVWVVWCHKVKVHGS